jgi:hypothetical protein
MVARMVGAAAGWMGRGKDALFIGLRIRDSPARARLNAEDLREWLEKYSLGDLWSKGEIGGNRW